MNNHGIEISGDKNAGVTIFLFTSLNRTNDQ